MKTDLLSKLFGKKPTGQNFGFRREIEILQQVTQSPQTAIGHVAAPVSFFIQPQPWVHQKWKKV